MPTLSANGAINEALNDLQTETAAPANTNTPIAPTAPPTVQQSPMGDTFAPPEPAAPAPATGGMFSDALGEIGREDTERLYGALEMARRGDPERYDKAKSLADRDGLTIDYAIKNLPDLESRRTAADMRVTLEGNPRLKQWFTTGDNANAVKFDDLHKLDGLSWILQAGSAALSEGSQQRTSAEIRARQLFGRASPDEITQADAADKEENRDFGAESFWQGIPIQFANQLPQFLGSAAQGFKRGVAGSAIGAAMGAAGGPVGAAGGALAGFGVGYTAGTFEDSFKQEAGGAFSEYLHMKTEDGRPLDESTARGAAFLTGLVNGGLETLSDVTLAKLVPGFDKTIGAAFKVGGRTAVKEALRNPTFRAAATAFGASVVKGGATEIGTEVLQEGMTLLSGLVAQKVDGGQFQPIEGREVAARLGQTAVQTAQAMMILTPVLASSKFGSDLRTWRRSEAMREVYDQANTVASESELRTRSPGTYLGAIKELLGDGRQSDTVYVPADKLTELFQSMGLSPADLDARIDGFSQRYAEAVATGNDVHIPMAEYQTHIAGTDLGAALIDHQRWHPELETVDEARKALAAAKERTDDMLQQAMDDAKADQAARDPAQRVYDQIYANLVNVGEAPEHARAQAELYRGFFGTAAARSPGVDAFDLFQRQGLDIRRAMPDGLDYRKTDELDIALDALRRGEGDRASRARAKAKGPTLAEFLIKQGGLTEGEVHKGELSSRDLGKFKGGKLTPKEGGMTLDDASLHAIEAGYFPDRVTEEGANRDGAIDDLLSAIDEETAGRPTHAVQDHEVRIDPQLERLEALQRDLDTLGLDTSSMTNEDIRKELMKATAENAEQGALFQTAPATDTPEFKSWFGDSKVVDAAGRPLVVYHGTNAMAYSSRERIETFLTAGERTGAFFSSSQAVATEYGEAIYPVYLSLQNPLIVDAGGKHWTQIGADAKTEGRVTPEVEKARRKSEADIDTLLNALFADGLDEGGRQAPMGTRPIRINTLADIPGLGSGGETDTISRVAKRMGYDGVIIRNVNDSPTAGDMYAQGLSDIYVALRGAQIKSTENVGTFDPSDPRILYQTASASDLAGKRADKRGSIQFMGDRTVINLFQAANLSTFLHETGHLFLELNRQLAENADAPEQIRSDWQTVLDYIGAKSGEAIPREAHEKFATSFESYLAEGRAPSADLQGVFERFKSWLLFVYRRVSGLATLSPEIRDVFDRMLATDEEIAEARREPSFVPLFKTAADAAMTDAQWVSYLETAQRATDTAKGELLGRLMGEKRREASREWRTQKTATREAVTAELTQQPVYQVQHFIRTGEVQGEGGAPELTNRRLDKEWLVNRYGPDVLKRLPKTVPPIYTTKGGVHPDEMAEWFGFSSGEAMADELMSAPSLPRAINGRVDQIMREQHGDLLSNQAAIADAATQALTNDERGLFLEAELKSLSSRAGGKGTVMPRQMARSIARQVIRGKSVAEATRPGVYARTVERSAREAERAVLSGDFAAAAEWKRRQLLNHFLTQEATKARDEADAARRYLDRFSARKRPSGVDFDYLDQIDGVLDKFEFNKSTSLRSIERRKSLAAFVTEREAEGDMFTIPQELLDDSKVTSYKDMTLTDLLGMRDVVKNLEHLGRLKNRLLEKGRLRSFETIRDQLVTQTLTNPTKRQQKYRNPTSLEKFRGGVAGIDAWLLKQEQVFQWLDKGDVNGPWTRLVFQRFVDAQNRKGEMQGEYATKLRSIMDGLPKGYLAERKAVPGNPRLSFTMEELYAIALNQGSESNRDKILRGEVTSENSFRSEAEMESALSVLSKEDWDRVQSIWDTIEGLWPEIAALQRRITGVEPPRVERREVQTQHGTYRGGYYPMVYDPRQSFDVQQRADAEADKLFEKTYVAPATSHGFTKARVEGYTRPVLLAMSALPNHIEAVIHDTTHREAVRDVLKILRDKQVSAALDQTMGRAVYVEMNKWLSRIASDRGAPTEDTAFASLVNKTRTNMSLYAMGFRFSTAMSQFAGFSNSLELVKPSHLGSALVASIKSPSDTWQLVQSKSGEMRDRTNNMERDVRAALAKLDGREGLTANVQKTAFYLVAMADKAVTVPTWLGGYNQHLAEYPTDEAGAVRAGDRAVRLTQGSGAAKDLASVMGNKNPGAQLLTMFYSYFNLQYNRLRTLGRDGRAMTANGTYEDLPHLVARSIALVILPAILSDALVGRLWDKDENPAWWAFKKAALYPFMSVPVLRDVASHFDSGFGYKFTPASQPIETFIKLVQNVEAGLGGDLDARNTAKNAASLTGYVFGLPVGQALGTADNVWKGIEQNDFKVRDLLFSRKAFADERKDKR